MAHRAVRGIGVYIEEIILSVLILLNILDFAEILPPFWDFVKKIISWSVLGFLLYKVSLTKVFFGQTNKKYDFLIIISYFTLIVKNLIEYIIVAREILFANISDYIGFSIVDKTTALAYTVKNIAVDNYHQLNFATMVPLDVATDIMTQYPQKLSLLNPEYFFRLFNDSSEVFISLGAKTLDGALIPLYNTLVMNKAAIEEYMFYIGILFLFILSFIMAFKILTKKNSLLFALTRFEEKAEDRTIERVTKGFVVFGVLLFFFVVVFNLTMEWLAIAIDAPLLMIALVSYPFVLHKHHKKFHADSFLFRIGDFGSEFYEKFISLFHSRRGIFLGISGMLVLHLLTDVGNYIFPYVLSFHDALYLTRFDNALHMPIKSLINASITQLNISNVTDFASIIFLYALNVIAMLFLLIFPAYLWYKLLKKEQITPDKFPRWILALFFPSVITYLIWPAFKIAALNKANLIGVNIMTQIIPIENAFLVREIAIGMFILFVIILIATHWSIMRRFLILAPIFGSMIFFGIYLFHYLISCFAYYTTLANGLFAISKSFMGVIFYIFLCINIIFYIGGFFIFCYKTIVEEEE